MNCPSCDADNTRVIDTRHVADGNYTRRRRECQDCGHRFTTHETLHLGAPKVVKRDGRREAFHFEKLRRSLCIATAKRPVSEEQIARVVDTIERKVMASSKSEIEAHSIGRYAMHELRRLDSIAYVRFASVYHRFQDSGAFRDIADDIAANPRGNDRQMLLDLGGD